MQYHKSSLSNGLRLITIPMPSAESVTVLITVGAGSRFEEKKINGISHFLEHMAFKGTKKRPSALAISSIIDGIGGEFNAFTSKDHTGYYIKAAKKHLPLLVDVLSDMLLHSKFDPAELEKERGVIIEEINMYEDTPMKKIADLYENLLYGDTKLGRDIAGKKEVIKSVTREDFLDYVDRFYGPGNTIVSIAGAIEENSKHEIRSSKQIQNSNDQNSKLFNHLDLKNSKIVSNFDIRISDLINKYLGSWKGKQVVAAEKVDDGQSQPQVLVKYKDTQQAHLCLGVRSYKLTHKDRYALGVLTAILGGGMSSRLFIQVRERRGLAYYVRSANEQYTDVGNFVTQAGVDVARIEDAIKVMLEEFAKIAAEKVAEEELARAKEYLKGRFTLELEDSRNVAALFAVSELLEDKIRTPKEMVAAVDKVTIDDVKRVAADIFKQGKLNLAIIGPYKQSEKLYKILTF